jgi:hypothetical protein
MLSLIRLHSEQRCFFVSLACQKFRTPALIECIVNAVNDRETEGYTAVDYVQYARPHDELQYSHSPEYRAVVRSLNARRGHSSTIKERPASAYITYLVYIGGSKVFVDEVELKVGRRILCMLSPTHTLH